MALNPITMKADLKADFLTLFQSPMDGNQTVETLAEAWATALTTTIIKHIQTGTVTIAPLAIVCPAPAYTNASPVTGTIL